MKKIFLYILLMVITATVFGQNVYVVTKTTDPNPFTDPYKFNDAECDPDMLGTLQWAINKSNDDNAESVIEFNIPGTGPHEIVLNSYLPQIKNPVIIDGTTQAGYTTGSPVVKITGQIKTQYGLSVYHTTVTIKGLEISNFARSAIMLNECSNSKIIDNKIYNISSGGYGIHILASKYVEIYGNRIEVDALPEYGRSSVGIYINKCSNCTIGGTETGKANIIANCEKVGVAIIGNKYNKVSGNSIYNNPKAILLVENANDNIQPPVITSYTNGILSGTALPNSTVEVFGSTGVENANEYLGSAIADGGGAWDIDVSTGYEYFKSTQTSSTNNTSSLSNSFINPRTTQLLAMFQNADSVDLDDFLYARKLDGALQYQFNVIQVDSGVNQIITKDGNYFSLLELENNEAYYDKEYRIKVRAIFEEDTADWGAVVNIKSISFQKYQYGLITLKLDEFNSVQFFETISNNAPCEILGIEKTFSRILHKLPDLSNIYTIKFDYRYSTDSVINMLLSEPGILYAENEIIFRPFVNDPYYAGYTPCEAIYCNSSCNQWHLMPNRLNAEGAWSLINNDNFITVAIVDDAVMLDHVDLNNQIYINNGEIPESLLSTILSGFDIIPNGNVEAIELVNYFHSLYPSINSIVDIYNSSYTSSLFDNIDNDNNGYEDDVFGWDAASSIEDNFAYPFALPNPSSTIPYETMQWAHGTHVAGIAGAQTNNYLGVASLSDNHVKLIPIKVALDYNCHDYYYAKQGVEYAIEVGARIVNMSFGSLYSSGDVWQQSFQDLITSAHNELGTIFIAAMANYGNADPCMPAVFDNVVAVGATNINNEVWEYSNYGAHMDFLAPGTDIVSTFAMNTEAYSCATGTSMAAPMVSSLWALMLSANPNATFEDIYDCIESTALSNGVVGGYNSSIHGHGLINPTAAIECINNKIPNASYAILADVVCPDVNVPFVSNSSGGVPVSWHWTTSAAGVIISNPNNEETNISFPAPGNYTIQITVCNINNQCVTYSSVVTVADITANLLTTDIQSICSGTSSFAMIEVNGNPSFEYTYIDNLGNSHSSTSDNNIITIPLSGEGTYVLNTLTDNLGCNLSEDIDIIAIEGDDCECNSTRYNNNWICGNKIFNFTNGELTNFSYSSHLEVGGEIHNSADEAIATLSNDEGNLILFTDGLSIRNGSGVILKEITVVNNPGTSVEFDIEKCNDVMILPHPVNRNIFYIFFPYVTDVTGTIPDNVFRYYIIDYTGINQLPNSIPTVSGANVMPMSNAGLGIHLDPSLFIFTERMTWAPKSSGDGYWIIASSHNADRYAVYFLNSAGQISLKSFAYFNSPGVPQIGGVYYNMGEMSYCKETGLLAVAYTKNKLLRLYSFNNTNGIIEYINQLDFSTINPNVLPYGVEFSSSGKYLYYSSHLGSVYRIPIVSNNFSSPTNINTFDYSTVSGELQLSQNNQIFVGHKNNNNDCNYVGVFQDPNNSDPLQVSYIDISGVYNSNFRTNIGLPQLLPEKPFVVEVEEVFACENCENAANINTDILLPPYTIAWSNGQSGLTASQLCSGIDYYVTVQDQRGCMKVEEFDFDYYSLNLTVNSQINICVGSGNTDSFSFSISGGSPLYNIEIIHESSSIFTELNTNTTNFALNNLSIGTYSIAVTDEYGCSANLNINIVEVSPPDISFSTIEPTCNGSSNDGSATIQILSGGGTNYLYHWPSSETSQTATHLSSGLNVVTVIDNYGCTYEASVTIPNLHVDASFKYYPCLELKGIELGLVHFYAAAIPEADWSLYDFDWDMGNGQLENTPEVIPTYAYEGYYCPQLTVSRDGCVDTQQETVYVNPTSCYCDNNTFDFTSVTISNEEYPDIISPVSSGLVMNNQEIYIKKDLIIAGETHLTLNNCILHFGPEGRIVIKPSAVLISNSSTFTSFENGESCNHMWQGIEVEGVALSKGRIVLNVTDPPSVIKNAHIGILTGSRNKNYICSCPSGNPYQYSLSGGQITAYNADFINNGTDIKMPRTILVGLMMNNSIIVNCNFICNSELLDEGYDISHDDPYGFGEAGNWMHPANTFFNPRNPWAGRANETQRSNAAIWAQNQKIGRLAYDTFENKEDGILTYDSKYNVLACVFSNAINGISIFNTNPFIDRNHEISKCTFDLIPNNATDPDAEGACIRIDGGMFDFVHDNTFGTEATPQTLNDHGIRMTNASGFRIIENNFNNLRTGVNISESGNEDGEGGYVGAGLSIDHANWTGNVYTQCRTNILTSGLNDNLQLKCNMCDNEYNNLFDVNFESSGTLANQGSLPYGSLQVPFNKRKFAAGNEFDGSYDPINPSEPYYKEINSSTSYEYFHHTDPFMAIPVPTTTQITTHSIGQPKISNELSCPKPFIGHIHIYDDIAIELPSDFDDSFDFVTSIGSLNGVINGLQYEQQEMILSLDNGNTNKLISDIQNRVPQGKLKNDLINCSPLSDTVLTALIVEYPLSHGNFKNVMLYNLPVSRNVSTYLNERLKTLPRGIANQLIPLMAENNFAVTPAALQREIEFFKLEKQLYINEIIFRLLDTSINNKAAVVSLLEEIDTWSAKQLLFSDMLNNGEYIQAASFLSDFDRSNSEINDWVELNEILLSLYSNNKTLYEMDSTQLAFVTDLAYKCPSKRGSAGARSIIHMLFGEEVPACVEMQSRSTKLMIKDIDFVMPDSDAYMEDNFPDPFTDYTLINYYLPEEMTGKIIVNDMFGRIIAEYKLEVGENTLEIINNNWAPGVYSYGMIVNDKAIEFKKMVITQ